MVETADDEARTWRVVATDVVIVGGGVTSRTTWRQALGSFAGAIGVTLVVPVAIVIVGLPVALAVRVVVEGIGWLAAFVLK